MTEKKDKPRRRIAGESSPADRTENPVIKRPPTVAKRKPAVPAKPSTSEPREAAETTATSTVDEKSERTAPKAPYRRSESRDQAAPKQPRLVLPGDQDSGDSTEKALVLGAIYIAAAVVAFALLASGLFLGGRVFMEYRELGDRLDRETAAVEAAEEGMLTIWAIGEETSDVYQSRVDEVTTPAGRSNDAIAELYGAVPNMGEASMLIEPSPVSAAALPCGEDCAKDTVNVLVSGSYVMRAFGMPLGIGEYRVDVEMLLVDGEWKINNVEFLGLQPLA